MQRPTDSWEALVDQAQTGRAVGKVILLRESLGGGVPARDAADALMAARGFERLGDRWFDVDRETAEQSLSHVFATELSSDQPAMAASEAARLAAALLDRISPATYLTNGAWVAGVIPLGWGTRIGPFWTPVTSPAFDGGVIAVARDTIAMLWVEDHA